MTQKNAEGFLFIDLFAGIGGFYMGMTANNGKCVFSSEWNKYAAKTYEAWTGHVPLVDDIREVDYLNTIPDHDVLCGGFPCQPFSIAGVSSKNFLGRAHGFDDEKQGNLFFAIAEIVQTKRPLVLFLENVKNLKSHDKGNTWKVISETIDSLGYELKAEVIDAQGWVPQHRERVFLVAFNRNEFTEEEISSFSFPTSKKKHKLSEILEKEPDERYMISDGLWAYLKAHAEKHRKKGNGFGYSIADPGGVTRTISARYYKDGSEILIQEEGWRNPRRLTVQEAAKLQGFNKRYAKMLGFKNGEFPQVVSDTQAYKQFGNAVCPLVVEDIGKEIRKVLYLRKQRISS